MNSKNCKAIAAAMIPFLLLSCSETDKVPSAALIKSINLKKGELISCGPDDRQFGTVDFAFSGKENVKEDFNLAVKLLHSFEYDEAEKVFARVIDQDPGCAMAYWGVAMSNFHPLWAPPAGPELTKGSKALEVARSITKKTKREADYIDALSAFYTDWDKADHRSRTLRFEQAMEHLYATYPGDKETAVFYALALNAAADPADKTYQKQKKAGAILTGLYPKEPNHPGIVHYIIHTYDNPELAEKALQAARNYAAVAPSSAHALHMPSHIFTRLGLWDECIRSNQASVNSAQCYATAAGIKGHWDEELHGLDYLVYAYLQKGDNTEAKKQWEYLNTITQVEPVNFKVAYAFAAIPSRYLLENKMWKEAAALTPREHFAWQQFPWQEGIIHFARLLGAAHEGTPEAARAELATLNQLRQKLLEQKDAYKANQVAIQIKTGEAWISLREGKSTEAVSLMNAAADMEDRTEKHAVTPGEVLPARELLGDLLLQVNQPAKALEAYEASLKTHANRFNGLYGAALAAERSGNKEKAAVYYRKLLAVSGGIAQRKEITDATRYVKAKEETGMR